MFGLLIFPILALLSAFSPCRAADKHHPMNDHGILIRNVENLSPGLRESFYYECLRRDRVDFGSLSLADLTSYPVLVGMSMPKGYFGMEQRLSRTLDPLTAFPGGQMLCNAVMAGAKLYTFSQSVTTYGNRVFHTGYSLKNTSGSSFKTGFFLNF